MAMRLRYGRGGAGFGGLSGPSAMMAAPAMAYPPAGQPQQPAAAAPAPGPMAAPMMAAAAPGNPATASSPAFRASLDGQRANEARRALAFTTARAGGASEADANRQGFVAGQVQKAGLPVDYLEQQQYAQDANRRTNAESGATVGYVNSGAQVNRSHAGVLDQEAATAKMMAPAMLASATAGTARTVAETGQIPLNGATARDAAAAAAGHTREQTVGLATQNRLAGQFGAPLAQAELAKKAAETAAIPTLSGSQADVEHGRANAFNAEAWARMNPPQPAADPIAQMDALSKQHALATQMGDEAYKKAIEAAGGPGSGPLAGVLQAEFDKNGVPVTTTGEGGKPTTSRKKKQQYVDEAMAELNKQLGRAGGAATGPKAAATDTYVDPKTGAVLRRQGNKWVPG